MTWGCGCWWREKIVRADVEFEGLEVCGAFGLPGVQRLSEALDFWLQRMSSCWMKNVGV